MKLNKNKFDSHPYISCKKHPTLDLYLYNYTHGCQFDRAWDEYTTMARGLVLDSEGNIVSYPMKKFFNYGEVEDTKFENLPKETPNITIKEDGSLLILSWYKDQMILNTRGSFESDQAIWSGKYIKNEWPSLGVSWGEEFRNSHTLMFECIYPENRIVIDYKGYFGLKLITVINKVTGEEWSYKDMVKFADQNGFDFVYEKQVPHIRELLKIVENLGPNQEGFVCRYSNGLRMKIKGDEYVRLHKLISGVSTKSIWDCMTKGLDIDAIIAELPDEMFGWALGVYKDLEEKYKNIESVCQGEMKTIFPMGSRKERAQYIMSNRKEYSGVLFAMIDGKPYKHIIWGLIQPDYEKPASGKCDEN